MSSDNKDHYFNLTATTTTTATTSTTTTAAATTTLSSSTTTTTTTTATSSLLTSSRLSSSSTATTNQQDSNLQSVRERLNNSNFLQLQHRLLLQQRAQIQRLRGNQKPTTTATTATTATAATAASTAPSNITGTTAAATAASVAAAASTLTNTNTLTTTTTTTTTTTSTTSSAIFITTSTTTTTTTTAYSNNSMTTISTTTTTTLTSSTPRASDNRHKNYLQQQQQQPHHHHQHQQPQQQRHHHQQQQRHQQQQQQLHQQQQQQRHQQQQQQQQRHQQQQQQQLNTHDQQQRVIFGNPNNNSINMNNNNDNNSDDGNNFRQPMLPSSRSHRTQYRQQQQSTTHHDYEAAAAAAATSQQLQQQHQLLQMQLQQQEQQLQQQLQEQLQQQEHQQLQQELQGIEYEEHIEVPNKYIARRTPPNATTTGNCVFQMPSTSPTLTNFNRHQPHQRQQQQQQNEYPHAPPPPQQFINNSNRMHRRTSICIDATERDQRPQRIMTRRQSCQPNQSANDFLQSFEAPLNRYIPPRQQLPTTSQQQQQQQQQQQPSTSKQQQTIRVKNFANPTIPQSNHLNNEYGRRSPFIDDQYGLQQQQLQQPPPPPQSPQPPQRSFLNRNERTNLNCDDIPSGSVEAALKRRKLLAEKSKLLYEQRQQMQRQQQLPYLTPLSTQQTDDQTPRRILRRRQTLMADDRRPAFLDEYFNTHGMDDTATVVKRFRNNNNTPVFSRIQPQQVQLHTTPPPPPIPTLTPPPLTPARVPTPHKPFNRINDQDELNALRARLTAAVCPEEDTPDEYEDYNKICQNIKQEQDLFDEPNFIAPEQHSHSHNQSQSRSHRHRHRNKSSKHSHNRRHERISTSPYQNNPIPAYSIKTERSPSALSTHSTGSQHSSHHSRQSIRSNDGPCTSKSVRFSPNTTTSVTPSTDSETSFVIIDEARGNGKIRLARQPLVEKAFNEALARSILDDTIAPHEQIQIELSRFFDNYYGIKVVSAACVPALRRLVDSLPPLWDGCKLRLVSKASTKLLCIKCIIKKEHYTFSFEDFLKIVTKQNPTINTENWRLLKKVENGVANWVLVLGVDQNSYRALQILEGNLYFLAYGLTFELCGKYNPQENTETVPPPPLPPPPPAENEPADTESTDSEAVSDGDSGDSDGDDDQQPPRDDTLNEEQSNNNENQEHITIQKKDQSPMAGSTPPQVDLSGNALVPLPNDEHFYGSQSQMEEVDENNENILITAASLSTEHTNEDVDNTEEIDEEPPIVESRSSPASPTPSPLPPTPPPPPTPYPQISEELLIATQTHNLLNGKFKNMI